MKHKTAKNILYLAMFLKIIRDRTFLTTIFFKKTVKNKRDRPSVVAIFNNFILAGYQVYSPGGEPMGNCSLIL